MAVRAWHFFATSTVMADALPVIGPITMPNKATSVIQNFTFGLIGILPTFYSVDSTVGKVKFETPIATTTSLLSGR